MQTAVAPGLEKRIGTYGSSARTHLLTILRIVMLEREVVVWTSQLIRALGACGILERNARQTINRLSETGVIVSEKVGARVRWRLTARGKVLLERGQRRAEQFGGIQADWDGRWLVVVCSVPEKERENRRRFKGRLELNGFGFVSPGIAVSTHLEKEPFANEILREFGLDEGALVLLARPGDIIGNEALLQRAWDIEALDRNYVMFIDMVTAIEASTDEEKFGAFVELERAWFIVAFSDPELPSELLPADWRCIEAKHLYEEKHSAWRPAAMRWFETADAILPD